MTKKELIAAIAQETKGSVQDVKIYLDAFIVVVEKTLKEGEKITLNGLGTLQAKKKLSNK